RVHFNLTPAPRRRKEAGRGPLKSWCLCAACHDRLASTAIGPSGLSSRLGSHGYPRSPPRPDSAASKCTCLDHSRQAPHPAPFIKVHPPRRRTTMYFVITYLWQVPSTLPQSSRTCL
ncbi:hypothetical protein SPRG_19864, partial [Saprolegnia parasitica CBS 223.65]